MSVLTEAIHAEIKERRARNPGRPDRELLEHILVAVQRERVVAVGFDSARIGERLARSPLPEEAKQLMSRAVGQVWLDENMHARYLIGLLDRQPELGVQLARTGRVDGMILLDLQVGELDRRAGTHPNVAHWRAEERVEFEEVLAEQVHDPQW